MREIAASPTAEGDPVFFNARSVVSTGLAVTIGSANIDYWSRTRNIDALIARSGPLAFFIERIPMADARLALR